MLLTLRTATRVGCPFCIDANSAEGRTCGLGNEETAAIREGRIEGFATAEAALMRMADTLSNVSDELYGELRRHLPKSN